MTVRVMKSMMPENFEDRVEAYRKGMLAHRFQVNVPAPTEEHLIESCVKRAKKGKKEPDDFIADYVIIDDLPPPPTLRQRKDYLLHAVQNAERLAGAEILPPGKMRLLGLQANEILLLKEEDRTDDQKQQLVAFAAKQDQLKDLSFKAAQMQSDIEDLTEDNIGSWALTPFA